MSEEPKEEVCEEKVGKVEEEEGEEEEAQSNEIKDKEILLAVSAESLKYELCDTVFLQSNERFHGVFRSSFKPKKVLKYKVVWNIVEITHPQRKMMNQICYQNEREFVPNLEKNETRLIIYFYLQNSRRINLPVGNYRVDVFIEDKFELSKDFNVVNQNHGGIFVGKNSFVTGEFVPERCFSPYIGRIAGHFYFSTQHLSLERDKKKMTHYSITWKREGKTVFEKMIDVKPKMHTSENILMFAYKNPGTSYEPGFYECTVCEIDRGDVGSINFRIVKRRPEIFVGTVLDDEGRIIDDRPRFPGNVPIIGLCTLTESEMKQKCSYSAKLFKLKGENRKALKIINFKDIQSEKKEVLIFEFDQTKEFYPPGIYEVQMISTSTTIPTKKKEKEEKEEEEGEKKKKVVENKATPTKKVIATRVFQILHRFDVNLTTRSGKNRKPIQHYRVGTKWMNYHLIPTVTQKFHPQVNFTVCVIAIGSQNLAPGTVMVSKRFTLEAEEKEIKRKLEVKSGLPVGRFELRIFMAGMNISSLFFNVFQDNVFDEIERRVMKSQKMKKKK